MMAIHLPIFLPMFVVFCAGNPTIKQPPVWRDVYTVKGVLNITHSKIEEPFHGWYNGPGQKSRIDYYGGMTKTYQLGNVSPYGRSLKLVPVTTKSVKNKITCLKIDGTEHTVIEPQTILPDLTGFSLIGEETIDSVVTEEWQLNQTIDQHTIKHAMWLYYKVDPDNNNSKIPVPVKYAMKGYNSVLGRPHDHYYLEYSDYNVNDIDSEIFKIPDNMRCNWLWNPGHEVLFNTMKAFIHPTTTGHVDFEFEKFTRKHGKNYTTDREQEHRKNIFMHNLRYIHSINRQNLGYSLAVNHLADKSDLELKALRGRLYSGVYNGGGEFPYRNFDKWELPDQYDWRLHGAVTPVKDQSVCGSCWSFGAVGAIEGAYFLETGQLKRLSQQALIDCSWGYDNCGCDGGLDSKAYQWVLKHGGIPTEDDYGPYLAQDGYCHADEVPKVAKITGYVNVTQNNQNALKLAIFKHGPISVSIDASQNTFSFYSDGVYHEEKCNNNKLNHVVLAVGYGTLKGEDFWLIKNSWSNYWGNDGYILMSARDNNCGVMTIPTYVTM